MLDPITGNNVVEMNSEGGSLTEIAARVAAMDAQLANPNPTVTTLTTPPPQNPQEPAVTTPPSTVAEEVQKKEKDSLQQFRDKEGNVSEDKILQANEHLEKGIKDRQDRQRLLLERNKELRRSFTQESTAAKQLEAEAKKVEGLEALALGDLTPELRAVVIKDWEADPVATQLKLIDARIRQAMDKEVRPLQSKVMLREEEAETERSLKEIDELVNDGNEWILTEGVERLKRVLEERPYLKQSRTPFKDAIKFVDNLPSSGRATNAAQVGPKTPILGSAGAIPPPSSVPPVSAEGEMDILSKQLQEAMQMKNYAKAREIEVKMDMMYRKVMGR